MFETKSRVRYVETDQMGVAHHSVYLYWFEIGRTELLKSIGYNYALLEKNGLLLPVLHVEIRYFRSLFYDEEISIRVRILKIKKFKIEFEYTLLKENGETAAIGTTTLGIVDSDFKPKEIEKNLIQKLKQFLKKE
ncbi:MAG: hypothetical protein CL678_05165 [Bdellovibrionaceae bacterium]|nr:hypothetical protein [Pseudobdellovibrionaceae bacterium]|tara:strand:- start:1703 stop:2107 length:405 start_codon:yes stop_codon:yes gene_type:complete